MIYLKGMKKFISLLCLIVIVINSYAQQVTSTSSQTREKYLQKSKSQKVGSVLLVVAGCTIGLVGGLASAVSAGGNSGPDFPVVPVAMGVGCLAGSVALSKAAARNKEKALAVSAILGPINLPNRYYAIIPYPAGLGLTLKVDLL